MQPRSENPENRSSRFQQIVKVQTKIVGMDEVLEGGIPKGSLTLLSGGPGTGKTMLGLEFLIRGALDGQPGILLTFEETEDALRNYARGFGWDVPELEAQGRLWIISARIQPDAIRSGDFDLRGIFGMLRQKARDMGASRILIDAPDVFLRLLDNISKERAELYVMHEMASQGEFDIANDRESGHEWEFYIPLRFPGLYGGLRHPSRPARSRPDHHAPPTYY